MPEFSYRSVVEVNYIPDSVEAVPILEGDNLLETVDHWNNTAPEGFGIAWHGSPYAVTRWLWRGSPYWIYDGVKYPDSDGPVVCADTRALVAAFYALGPRGKCTIGGNKGGGAEFGVKRQYRDDFLRAVGYVAALPIEDFMEFTGGAPEGWPNQDYIRLPELRSSKQGKPLFVVKVACEDFLGLLEADPVSNLSYT